MSESAEPQDELQLPHLTALIGGGLLLGAGILNLYFSFGLQGASGARVPFNTDPTTVGFTGIDNITPLGPADYAIPLVVIGVILMVWANATMWKKTGGW